MSQKPILYLGSLKSRLKVIDGDVLQQEESDEILTKILEEMNTDENTYYHTWEKGDLLLWDNTLVFHRATHYDKPNANVKRILHRTQAFIN